MNSRSLSHLARALALVLLIGVVAALAASNAAWAGPSKPGPNRGPGRSTVPRRGTDLEIWKSYRRDSWGDLTFTIVVTNTGPIAAQDVVMTDIISRRLDLNQVTTTKGECFGDPLLRCQHGNLAVSEVVTTTVHTSLWLDMFRGTLRNTATVTSKTPDTEYSNNSYTVVFDGRATFVWLDRFRRTED